MDAEHNKTTPTIQVYRSHEDYDVYSTHISRKKTYISLKDCKSYPKLIEQTFIEASVNWTYDLCYSEDVLRKRIMRQIQKTGSEILISENDQNQVLKMSICIRMNAECD